MPRARPAASNRLFDYKKTPWPLRLLFFVCIAAVAYVVAVVIYVVAYRLVQIPHGELMDDSIRPAFMYILLMIAIGALLLPMFNREWDPTIRRFGLLTSLFIVLFVTGKSLGIFTLNPEASLREVVSQIVNPITQRIKPPPAP